MLIKCLIRHLKEGANGNYHHAHAADDCSLEGNANERGCINLSVTQFTTADIPDYVMDNLARALLEAVDRFYRDPENVRKFEEWKARKAAEASV